MKCCRHATGRTGDATGNHQTAAKLSARLVGTGTGNAPGVCYAAEARATGKNSVHAKKLAAVDQNVLLLRMQSVIFRL